MRTFVGDLLALALEGRFDVIVHGCNCQCTMQRGIAGQIHKRFPEAYAADLKTLQGDRAKLGTITCTAIDRAAASFIIVNAYTQFDWRGAGLLADYDAIRSCFRIIKNQFPQKRIGYPRIGAGLARGDWPTIAKIIDEELCDADHSLVILDEH